MSASPSAVVDAPRTSGSWLRSWITLGLPLIGAGLAFALLQDHLTVAMGNHAEGWFCSGAGHFDCNPVAAHPAYLGLVGPNQPPWDNRAHFFGAAARAIRRILVDRARERNGLKRGGGKRSISLDEALLIAPS